MPVLGKRVRRLGMGDGVGQVIFEIVVAQPDVLDAAAIERLLDQRLQFLQPKQRNRLLPAAPDKGALYGLARP